MKTAAYPRLPFRLLAVALLALGLGQAARADIILAGSLDQSFGNAGIIMNDFSAGRDEALGLAIRDGVIVAVGRSYNPVQFALVAYDQSGSLVGSPVTTSCPGWGAEAKSVAWTNSGQVVVAGHAYNLNTGEQRFALANYAPPDWRLNPHFGDDGKVMTAWSRSGAANAVAVQSNGRILAAGHEYKGTFSRHYDFALARYLSHNGSLDTSFGGNGRVSTGFGDDEFANALAIDHHDRIIAAGFTYHGGRRFALARYLPANGALDPAFGDGGKVTTLFNDGRYEAANAVAIRGNRTVAAGVARDDDDVFHIALARYLPDGSPDPDFGAGGKLMWHPDPASGDHAVANAVAVQGDGKIVVAGYLGDTYEMEADHHIILVRFNHDGSLDTGFGDNGLVQTITGNGSRANAIALQPDGRIVIAGFSKVGTMGGRFLLARYHARTYTGVEIILDSTPSNPTSDPLPSFEFHMTAPGNVFHCFLESDAVQGYWHRCGSPFIPAVPLEDGEWSFKVRGRDEHGNETPTVEYRFFVDSTLPDDPDPEDPDPEDPDPEHPAPDKIFSDRFQGDE